MADTHVGAPSSISELSAGSQREVMLYSELLAALRGGSGSQNGVHKSAPSGAAAPRAGSATSSYGRVPLYQGPRPAARGAMTPPASSEDILFSFPPVPQPVPVAR